MGVQATAAILNTVANVIGGFGAKSALEKDYELKKSAIKTETKQRIEDIRYGVQEVVGGIRSASYAQGRRDRAPGIEKSEIDKYQLRTFRVLQQESQALKSLKEGRRQGLKQADLQIATSLAMAPADYQAGKYNDNLYSGKNSYYSPETFVGLKVT